MYIFYFLFFIFFFIFRTHLVKKPMPYTSAYGGIFAKGRQCLTFISICCGQDNLCMYILVYCMWSDSDMCPLRSSAAAADESGAGRNELGQGVGSKD